MLIFGKKKKKSLWKNNLFLNEEMCSQTCSKSLPHPVKGYLKTSLSWLLEMNNMSYRKMKQFDKSHSRIYYNEWKLNWELRYSTAFLVCCWLSHLIVMPQFCFLVLNTVFRKEISSYSDVCVYVCTSRYDMYLFKPRFHVKTHRKLLSAAKCSDTEPWFLLLTGVRFMHKATA